MRTLVRWYAGIYHREISYVKYMYFPVRQLHVAKLITRYTSYIAADLNAFFLCEKKMVPKKMALNQNDIFPAFFNNMVRRFPKTGDDLSCPRFLLSRLSV